MKVLLASPKGNISGGISRWTNHIIQYYQSLENTDIILDFIDTARKEYFSDNVSIFKRVVLAIKDYPSIIKRIKQKLKRGKYDIIHLPTSASLGLIKDYLIIKSAHKNNTKTVIHFRFGRTPELALKKNWEWRLLKKIVTISDKAMFIDKASFDTMKNHGFSNIELLPNPVAPNTMLLAEKYRNERKNEKEVLFVGHCIRTKGVYELMEACSDIKNIQLKFIGIADEGIVNYSKQQYGDTFISFLGEMPYEEIMRAMSSCYVFCLPSYTEGFPNVVLEAMACGCAIVATDVGAIPEMLENEMDEHVGLMVTPRDIDGLKIAINKMLENETFCKECRINARQRVVNRYSMPQIWKRMVTIWSEVN